MFSRQDGDQHEADFQSQQALVASAKRNVESYRANLHRVIALQEYERITAPFDGAVTQRNTDVGALVGASGSASPAPMNSPSTPSAGSSSTGNSNTSGSSGNVSQAATPQTGQAQGGPIFAIAQIDKLRILVSVPEGYAADVYNGMGARVYVQERANRPITGKVTRLANSIDENTRTLLTEVDIDNRDRLLYPGMYAVVSLAQLRGVAPIMIPGDAVVVRQDKTSVAVVNNQTVQMRPVEIGRDLGPSVEILSGLREGDWVISTVTDSVQQGVKVRTRQSQEASQESSSQQGDQTSQAPDSGPDQYGDQSITNSKSETKNQKGKPGQQKGGQQQNQQQKKGSGQ